MGSGGGESAGAQLHGSSSSSQMQWPTWEIPSAARPTARLESPTHPPSTYEITHPQPSEYHGPERAAGLPQTDLFMTQEEWADWVRSANVGFSMGSMGSMGSQLSTPSQASGDHLTTADEMEAAVAALLVPGPAMSSFSPPPSLANGTSHQGPIRTFPPSVGPSGSYRQVQGWAPSQPAQRPCGGDFDGTYTSSTFWQFSPTAPLAPHSSTSTYPSGLFPPSQQLPPQPQPRLLGWPHPLQHSFRSTHVVPSLQSTRGLRNPGPSSHQNSRSAPYLKVPRPARPLHRKAAAQASASNSPSMGATPSDTASSSGSGRQQDTEIPGPIKWPKNVSCRCGYQFQYSDLDDSPLKSAYEHLENAHSLVKPPRGHTPCGWPGCDKSYSTPKDFERHFIEKHLGVQFYCKNHERCKAKFGRHDKRTQHEKHCQPKPQVSD
ncbi:hypothetical protein AAF712_006732 [Marasmius tenuissimus]|uniref:C2H2-type domain-containing protein n=1 Tax=Marasmius tenuissimus TaxID=585030 RepID=A0ABR2ZZ11_9AGAR